jgi:hypothetical protein
VDLFLSVRNPFYPKEWRTKRTYLPLIVLISTLYGCIIDFTNNE